MSTLLVKDLQEKAKSIVSVPTTTYLHNVSVIDDTVDIDGVVVNFDMQARQILSELSGAPSHYVKKLPTDLAGSILNFHLSNAPTEDARGTFQTFEDRLLAASDPEKNSLSLSAYLQVIAGAFSANDRVTTFEISDKGELLVNVVNSVLATEVRPGDVTNAGIQLRAYPDSDKPPVVSAFLYREDQGGLTITNPASKISLRSEDLFGQLEEVIQGELEELTQKLEAYAETATLPIEGDRALLIFNLASERNLPRKVLNRVMDVGATLPADATVYDLVQVFCAVAGEQTRDGNRTKLQSLAGEIVVAYSSGRLHRCNTCEHPLVDFDKV